MARSTPASAGMSIRCPRLATRVASSAAVLAAALGALAPSLASAARSCEDWHADVVGVEGAVALRRTGTTAWLPAMEHAQLCFGDTIRSESFSRATVVLPDNSMLRLDELTTITLDDPPSGLGTVVNMLLGALHIMSRDPRALTITTPHVNAGLEGTEFDIRIAENKPETEVAVLEGKVRVTNASGIVSVPSGNVAAATANGVPVITPARAVDLMRWASYYQPLFAGELPSPSREPTAAESADPAFFALRAAARLRYGRLDDASTDLASLRTLAPSHALGYALESVIELARGDQAAALASAQRAHTADASSVPALLALAYAQQEGVDLDAAASSIDAALKLEPDNALVYARQAELALARNESKAALASAERATSLDENFAGGYAVLGFIRFSAADIEQAIRAFERSIDLDQSAPLPRLGLGLALIAQGERTAGRREIEIAATLDPADGLIRAYLGKTYDAEHRDKLTDSQIALSKDLHPLDPTGWLYEALGTRSDNRPVGGLESLLEASARNGDRAPFRSRLFLDGDLATRSSGANSRVYRELGFEQLGLLEAMDATAADPADYAGHRLQSGLYSQRAGGEVARVGEVLIANLLEPATLVPIQPQLSQPALFIADSVGPSEIATTELSPLFTENGLRFRGSIVSGANQTYGDDIAIGGLHGRTSFSIGQYRWTTDGFRENNDIDHRIANAEIKFRATPSTTLSAELRSTEIEKGDLQLRFDPALYLPSRIHDDTDSVRLGVGHRHGDSDTVIATILALDSSSHFSLAPFDIATDLRGHGVDLQEIHRGENWRLLTGLAYAQRSEDRQSGSFGGSQLLDLEQSALYAYAHIDLSRSLLLTVGASADTFDGGEIDDQKVNPKLGMVWRASSRVTLRAAYFETLEGTLATSKEAPQPRLEPTEIAGFTQFLFASNGERSSASGVGVDLEVTPRSFTGVELAQRRVDYYALQQSGTFGKRARDETQDRAYIYWTPTQKMSLSAEYQYDRFLDDGARYGFTEMRTQRLPVELRYFGVQGLTAGVRASFVHQEGDFLMTTPFPPHPGGEDTFTVVDLSLGYRLPKRRGVLSLNIDNAFDEAFHFQDIDPENPSIMPERMAYLRFTLAFD
jgi:tetratricopeptide (TPR) repeat protein